jgi:hypothetical protein
MSEFLSVLAIACDWAVPEAIAQISLSFLPDGFESGEGFFCISLGLLQDE